MARRNFQRWSGLLLALACPLLLVTPSSAHAEYECLFPRDAREQMNDTDDVFTATVNSIKTLPPAADELDTPRLELTLKVEDVWKGLSDMDTNTMIIRVDTESLYQYTFRRRKTYLFYGFRLYPKRISIVGCPRALPVEEVQKALYQLGDPIIFYEKDEAKPAAPAPAAPAAASPAAPAKAAPPAPPAPAKGRRGRGRGRPAPAPAAPATATPAAAQPSAQPAPGAPDLSIPPLEAAPKEATPTAAPVPSKDLPDVKTPQTPPAAGTEADMERQRLQERREQIRRQMLGPKLKDGTPPPAPPALKDTTPLPAIPEAEPAPAPKPGAEKLDANGQPVTASGAPNADPASTPKAEGGAVAPATPAPPVPMSATVGTPAAPMPMGDEPIAQEGQPDSSGPTDPAAQGPAEIVPELPEM